MFEKSLEEEIESRPSGDIGGPVKCLGMTFPNDEKRREYFLEKLREKLQDPQFRKIDGFPIGEDEDILRLSDPPFYTACPNPFIKDFIEHFGTRYDPERDYSREPYSTDVSEGKNNPIYNAHSYHTKVPHNAIMRYILHYTEPGDVVFDGFCGTGMTGVAAQLCGDQKAVEKLGYRISDDGTVLQQSWDEEGRTIWLPFSKFGVRSAVLNDLCPAATFISHNYNTRVDTREFERQARSVLRDVEAECSWLYQTLHEPGLEDIERAVSIVQSVDPNQLQAHRDLPWGVINFTVWSDVFVCSECVAEIVFWDIAVDHDNSKVLDQFQCPSCHAQLTKRSLDRAWITKGDSGIGQTIRQAKQTPVLINYNLGTKRHEKKPDALDMAIIQTVENSEIPYWFPTNRMPEGEESRRNDGIGITHVHHFYTKRNLWVLAALWDRFKSLQHRIALAAMLAHSAANPYASKMRRYRPDKKGGGPLSGTLYLSSLITPPNVLLSVERNVKFVLNAFLEMGDAPNVGIVSSQSSTRELIAPDSVDYIFTDPPFGGNLMYSELNFMWEAWLRVITDNRTEAVENKVQGKSLGDYKELMTNCFQEYYKALKPGRWMTVEFHNSRNVVWNAIQEGLQRAGFVIADIRVLDKKQGSFKQVTAASAVKQDLIISTYKPSRGLEERFQLEAGTDEGVWDFLRSHLHHLPAFVFNNRQLEIIAERQNYLLFDRMVAFHVQRGFMVPMSAAEFYSGLEQRFAKRDGMYFLPDQVAEYDKKRMTVKEVLQLQLFVIDESSAIQWLRQQILKKPQTFQELHPQFMREIGGWQKHEMPLELLDLLNESFLRYGGSDDVPSQVHSYLSTNFRELRNLTKDDSALKAKAKDRWYVPDPAKTQDLERLRERTLLREFEEYRQSSQRKLRVFRVEAIRAGFKIAWQERDYATIIAVAGKIPENVLQEDPKLLMWYDQAITRAEG